MNNINSSCFFKAIGKIDPRFIDEDEILLSEESVMQNKKKRIFKKIPIIAAAFLVLFVMTVSALAATGVRIIYFFDPADEPEYITVYSDEGVVRKFIDPRSYPIQTIFISDKGIRIDMRLSGFRTTDTCPYYQSTISPELQPDMLSIEEIVSIAAARIYRSHEFCIDGLSGSMILVNLPDLSYWAVNIVFEESESDTELDSHFGITIDAFTGRVRDFWRHTPDSPGIAG